MLLLSWMFLYLTTCVNMEQENIVLDKIKNAKLCSESKCGDENESIGHPDENDSCGCKISRNKGEDNISNQRHKVVLEENSVKPEEIAFKYKRKNNMVFIDGGTFTMGTDHPIFKVDGESPSRQVAISSFYMDAFEVSNAEFARFVSQTGHITEAEIFGDSFVMDYFLSTKTVMDVKKAAKSVPWWLAVKGADWRHPEGPDSNITDTSRKTVDKALESDPKTSDRMTHPVLHASWNDAVAFCEWAGKRLPTEAEWEYSCRAGKENRLFPWGNKWRPNDRYLANIWTPGTDGFPSVNDGKDGYEMTAPVDEFVPNAFGLYNMIGNVWEWTSDNWTIDHNSINLHQDPKGPKDGESKVKKGGSFYCSFGYCYRYRCVARFDNTPDSSAHNLGFRCAADNDNLPNYLLQESNGYRKLNTEL